MTEVRNRNPQTLWWFLLVAVIVIVFLVINRGSNSQKITIPTPLGGMVVETNNGEINPTKLLDSLYSDDYTRGGLIQWLSNKNIYSVDDPALARALASQVCEPFPVNDLVARLRSEKECAEREWSQGTETVGF